MDLKKENLLWHVKTTNLPAFEKELPNKQKTKEKDSEETSKASQDRINSQLQSLDARTRNLTSKIDGLSSLVEELLSFSTQSNSSALTPCKLEDEFGRSHLCLLGENLHISGWKMD